MLKSYVEYYCDKPLNGKSRIETLVDCIVVNNFGWLPQCNYDDLYSIAGQVVWDCEKNFDTNKNVKFETLLISCLIKKIKTYITYINRKIRKQQDINGNLLSEISIDAVVNQDDNSKLINFLVGDRDVCTELLADKQEFTKSLKKYLSTLTTQQKEIALLLSDGYEPNEIQIILNISAEKYRMQWNKMTSLRKLLILCKERK